ncbi:MAG TPA: FtsX-like permease family protein [Methanocorpusculum sp.]|nr:FtsX-like permease family protein [Methanocorpusculum sp.]
MYTGSDTVRPAGSDERMQASIYGLNAADIADLVTVEEGKIPTGNNGVLIGRQLADDYSLSVGSRIEIPQRNSSTISVRVVGIMENSGSMTFTFSTDNAIIGTTDWYERFHETNGLYSSAMITVDNLDDLDPVITAIEAKMNGRTDRTTDDTVMISDARQFVESMQESIGMISVFIMALGGISLVVAAVSIFNVMLMSVNERIREIGILRSIGTLRYQILQMFLYEAAIIGFIGAVIGGVLSLIAAAVVISLMLGNISLILSPSVLLYVPYGILIGVIVCLLSGLYPAWKAANLNPVDALASD